MIRGLIAFFVAFTVAFTGIVSPVYANSINMNYATIASSITISQGDHSSTYVASSSSDGRFSPEPQNSRAGRFWDNFLDNAAATAGAVAGAAAVCLAIDGAATTVFPPAAALAPACAAIGLGNGARQVLSGMS